MTLGENKLVIGILIGGLLGVVCGWIFGPTMVSLSWLGDLFLDSLKMMIIPLIVGAVISGHITHICFKTCFSPVSYTHLTLPTICSV